MLNGRFALSLCAFLLGIMTMMALIAAGVRNPLAFDELAPLHVALIAGFILLPALHWSYIFFRRRGTKILVRSRPQLSISAFLLGEMLVMTLTSLEFVILPSFDSYSTLKMVSFVGLVIGLLMFWGILFFVRGGEDRKERNAKESAS